MKPTAEQMQAGIEVFAKYGELIAIDSLANEDVTKWKEIESLPVYVVIQKKAMSANKVLFERRLHAIQNKPTT